MVDNAMSGSNYMGVLVGMVDPKNAIPECREDNDRRTTAHPSCLTPINTPRRSCAASHRSWPGKVIPFAVDTRRGDEALNVDCVDVAKRAALGATSFEGFIVLESARSLDVTAIYAGPGGVDVEQIRERAGR